MSRYGGKRFGCIKTIVCIVIIAVLCLSGTFTAMQWKPLDKENQVLTYPKTIGFQTSVISSNTPKSLQSPFSVSQTRTSHFDYFRKMNSREILHSLPTSELDSQPVPNSIVPPWGLLSWWPGDRNPFDIVGLNPGAMHHDTTFTKGMVGETFSFDGSDDYIWASSTGVGDLQELTIEGWVRIDSMVTQPQRFVSFIGSKAVLRHDGADNLGQLHFYMNFGGAPWTGEDNLYHIRVDNVLSEDKWFHVAGTYDGSAMRLYLNGQLVGILGVSGTLFNWDGGIHLSSDTEPLCGSLDEISIYNRALPGPEITTIFQAGSDGKTKPTGEVVLPYEVSITSSIRFTHDVSCHDSGLRVMKAGITIDGANHILRGSNRGIGIWVDSLNDVTLTNCIVSQFDNGIRLRGTSNLLFSNNWVLENYVCGIHANSVDEITLSNNILSSNMQYGLYILRSTNLLISGNLITEHDKYALYLDRSTNARFCQNTVSHNTRMGIFLAASNHSLIAENNITNNGEHGILFSASHDNTIFNNTMCNNTGSGLWLSGSPRTILSHNMIFKNTGRGISLYGCNNNTLSNNSVCDNLQNGVYMYNSHNNNISNNTIYNNGIRGIYVHSANNNTISWNIIHDNAEIGIFLYIGCKNNTIFSNTISNNIGNGIYLYDDCSNNTISSNNILSQQSGAGIHIYSFSNNNTLFNNTLSHNRYGISLQTSSYNLAYNNRLLNNELQASDKNSPFGNYWYHSGLLEGNYWSDYIGVDLNRDGIGDTDVPWPGLGFDLYPLVYDADGDGLSDDAEPIIGTDPANPDHDGDGLLDGDEWRCYYTDPLIHTYLQLKLSCSFDFLLKEKVCIQIAGLLTDSGTGKPVYNAVISAQVYYPDERVVPITLIEQGSEPGIYVYKDPQTIEQLNLPKGIYLVSARAVIGGIVDAYDMIQFHVDPPSSMNNGVMAPFGVGLALIVVAGVVVRRRLKAGQK